MTGVLNSAMGALGNFGSNLWSGAGKVLSGAGDLAMGGLDSIGNVFSSGPTGQPASGTPDSMSALLSQSTPNLTDVSSGAAPISPSSFTADFSGDGLSRATSAALGEVAPGIDMGTISSIATAPAGEGGGFNVGDFLKKNALPAALMGYTLYRGNKTPDSVAALERLAADAEARSGTFGESASQAMQGRLPGGAMANLEAAKEAAMATIRSRYASLGLTGSTAEAQDLARAEMNALAQSFQMAQQLAQTGLSASAQQGGIANELYAAILQAETAQGSALGEALAAFAAGLVDYGAPS